MRVIPFFILLVSLSTLAQDQSWSISLDGLRKPFENWNFTPKDYRNLLRAGGKLEMANSSRWVPLEFQQNILSTLNFALSTEGQLAATDGINLKDFYHGHIACDGGMTTEAYSVIRNGEQRHRDLLGQALGAWYRPLKPESLENLIQISNELNLINGETLHKVLEISDCPELLMVYHTFEWTQPKNYRLKGVGDPRRNILTLNKNYQPLRFTPPDRTSSSSWMQLYSNIMQVAFLVDKNGKVHVVRGSTRELSAVTKAIGI